MFNPNDPAVNMCLVCFSLQISFTLDLNGQFDFSKCRGLTIRGFNKMKLYSIVSLQIRDCGAFDPILIKPKTVIDAVGTPYPDKGTYKCICSNKKKYFVYFCNIGEPFQNKICVESQNGFSDKKDIE